MSLAEYYHAAHKARLLRMGAPPRYQAPTWKPAPVEPVAFDFGWSNMWFHDLVTEPREPKEVRVRDIQNAVCRHFNVSILDMLSGRRTIDVSYARQVAMYFCKIMTPHSYAEIGRRFGGRDHTTIIHGHRKIDGLYGHDLKVTFDVNSVRRALS